MSLKYLLYTLLTFSFSLMANDVHIIPKPLSQTVHEGQFSTSSLGVKSDFPKLATYLKTELKKQRNIQIVRTAKNFIEVKKVDDKKLDNEGYALDISSDTILIKANAERGAFYGIQTLLQVFEPQAELTFKVKAPKLSIVDKPRFQWRGAHLDAARHFYSIEYTKKHLDYLAMHKINVFHWHLTEDQGWRVEIDKYPRLTSIGSWRKIDNYQVHASNLREETDAQVKARLIKQGFHKEIDGQPYYGGFYTKEQLKEIVAYAAERHITVVPEIEMPGHTQAVLAAYPELACEGAGDNFQVWNGFGISSAVFCAGKEETFTFLENVLKEVFEIFPSKIVHIGGDECPKNNWKKCSDCQKRIKNHKLHNEHELQSYFIKRMQKFINSQDRKIVGWSEILEGGLAPGATVMSWIGTKAGIEAARLGNEVIMSPNTEAYYNKKEDPNNQGPGQDGPWLPIERVYRFEPQVDELTPEQAKYVIGYQPCIWTEYVPTSEEVEWLLMPRIAASAEISWTSKEQRDFQDFSKRLISHYPRLDAVGAKYFIPPTQGLGQKYLFQDAQKFSVSTDFPQAKVHYTLDGSVPTRESKALEGEMKVTNSATIKTRVITPTQESSTNKTEFIKFKPKTVKQAGHKQGLQYWLYKISKRKATDLKGAKLIKNGHITKLELPKQAKGEMFAMKYKGILELKEDGVYTIYGSVDDAMRVRIAGQEVLFNQKANVEEFTKIELKKGFYPFEVEMYEYYYDEKIELSFSVNGSEKKAFSTEQLSH